jgi:hypothetical protein
MLVTNIYRLIQHKPFNARPSPDACDETSAATKDAIEGARS